MKLSTVAPMVLLSGALLIPTPLGRGLLRPLDAERASKPLLSATRAIGDGLTVHIDPATGQFLPVPDPSRLPEMTEGLESALSTSAEGLTLVPSPVPGGGVMVHLEGRFQNNITATVDSRGDVSTFCAATMGDSENATDDRGTTTPDDDIDGGEGE